MKIQEFNERLKNAILIADGAMGSLLHETVGAQRCFDELNATEPEAVYRVHQAYIEAGAQIIETNTFGANRFKLAPLGLGDEVQKLNSRGVKIAREARDSASREVLIAGSMGPLGLGVQSRHPEPGEIQEIFHEQALALEERGVDLYILETFSYIEELLLAIDAIRSFSGLPIIAQLTYSEEGTTFGDLRPTGAAEQLKNKNVQVIGANCTLGPQALLPILQELAGVADVRVSGMPNAGFPKREGDRIVYPKSSPEYFALFAREAAAMGVRILGGCCGTTPAHIQAMAEAVKSLRPVAATTVAHVRCGAKSPWRWRNASRRASSGASCRTRNLRCAWKSIRRREFRSIACSSRWTKSWRRGAWTPSISTAAQWRAWAWTRWWWPARWKREASKRCRT